MTLGFTVFLAAIHLPLMVQGQHLLSRPPRLAEFVQQAVTALSAQLFQFSVRLVRLTTELGQHHLAIVRIVLQVITVKVLATHTPLECAVRVITVMAARPLLHSGPANRDTTLQLVPLPRHLASPARTLRDILLKIVTPALLVILVLLLT